MCGRIACGRFMCGRREYPANRIIKRFVKRKVGKVGWEKYVWEKSVVGEESSQRDYQRSVKRKVGKVVWEG